ncbi:MAG: RelA/SpoT family protein [Pseudomonadota bacterium]|nr:RelA/SpoT family protein [Pseudomonadota bacterium]
MDSLHAFSDIQHTLSYLAPKYVKEVEKACQFAKKAHLTQSRISGEPYISHPLEVAKILAMLKLDHHTIIAGLLHDVVEDTPVTIDDLRNAFGEEVTIIVDGVTKISVVKYKDVVSYQAENYRKMFMAMTNDIRVIFVKLADRLHNMRTCQVMSIRSKRRMAKETLEVYAPIAKRLGMHNLSQELFELGFSACYPVRYSVLLEHMYRVNSGQADVLAHLSYQIKTQAKAQGVDIAEISFREKQLYGIYQKMILKRISFSDLMDVYALRICVNRVSDCYQLLGIVHSLYRPKERQLKDYVAAPKENGYQSIHTVLYGPYDMPIEIQIRTTEMHLVASQGVAAHWIYKSGASVLNQQKQQDWFKRLIEAQESHGEDDDYLRLVKHQVFSEEVYVLTPKGKVIELKRGATVLDLAYSIHTDVGHHSVHAMVDRSRSPLNQVLRNGQTVHIHTDTCSQPKPEWLQFVVTQKAKTAIKQFLRDKKLVSERKIGRQILSAGLIMRGVEGEHNEQMFAHIAKACNLQDTNDLFESLSMGKIKVEWVIEQSIPILRNTQVGKNNMIIHISDAERDSVEISSCCYPIPGDQSVAVTGKSQVVVHRSTCRAAKRMADQAVSVKWGENDTMFHCILTVNTFAQSSNLAYIVAMIVDMKSHIVTLSVDEQNGINANRFKISVRSLEHLALIIQSLNQIKTVHSVKRELRCGSSLLEQV